MVQASCGKCTSEQQFERSAGCTPFLIASGAKLRRNRFWQHFQKRLHQTAMVKHHLNPLQPYAWQTST